MSKKEISNFINLTEVLLEQDLEKSDHEDKKVYKKVVNDIFTYINEKLDKYD